MRRAQATVLLVAVAIAAAVPATLGLAYLGARVQAERAQRLADTAALRAARGLPSAHADPAGARITLAPRGTDVQATVSLPRVAAWDGAPLGFAARASATARAITTADGAPGAVLVG